MNALIIIAIVYLIGVAVNVTIIIGWHRNNKVESKSIGDYSAELLFALSSIFFWIVIGTSWALYYFRNWLYDFKRRVR